jgi:hypothetical protein
MTDENNLAWQAILKFYGDKRAARSGVLLINHIVEGLTVLDYIGATQAARDAFCLHPLFQDDFNLIANLPRVAEFSPHVIMLVMEYRNQANRALSDRVILQRGTPVWVGLPATPGPLAEVRDMLIADKVQNYADFQIYHADTHPRSAELSFYFNHWLQQLGVSTQAYVKLANRMKP